MKNALRCSRAVLMGLVACSLVLSLIALTPGPAAWAQDGEAEASASIRFVHASPDAPAVDVLLDGQPVAQGLEFGSVTEYAAASVGDHSIQVVPAGEGANSAFIEESIETDSGEAYTVAVANLLNALELRTFQSNLEDLPDGESRLRLVNLSSDAEEVDLFQVGGEQWFDNVSFGDASDHRNVPEGTYELDLRLNDSEVSLLAVPELMVRAGTEVTLLVIGNQSDSSVAIVPLEISVDTPCAQHLAISGMSEDACMRIVHASLEAPAVDVYVEDGLVVEALASGAATEFIPVPAGEGRSVKLVPAGGSLEDPLVESSVDLEARTATEIVIGGSVDDLKVINEDLDLSPLSAEQSRIRVIHVSPDAGEVDVRVTDGDPLFEGVGFENFTDSIIVDAGVFDIQVRRSGEDEVLYRSDAFELEPGMVYDVIAVGTVESGTFTLQVISAPAQLRAGDVAGTVEGATPGGETESSGTLDQTTPTPVPEEEGTPTS